MRFRIALSICLGLLISGFVFADATADLIAAIQNNNPTAVEAALANNANCNAPDTYGQTPLMKAAFKGNGTIITMLLSAGANANATDRYKATPLLFAVMGGKLEAVNLLINAGANIEAVDSTDTHCLAKAAHYGYKDIVSRLLAAGTRKSFNPCSRQTRRSMIKTRAIGLRLTSR